MNIKPLIVSITLLVYAGISNAKSEFSILEGIPVNKMSDSEMAIVEGKSLHYLNSIGLVWLSEKSGDLWKVGIGRFFNKYYLYINNYITNVNSIKTPERERQEAARSVARFSGASKKESSVRSSNARFLRNTVTAGIHTKDLLDAHPFIYSHSILPGTRK